MSRFNDKQITEGLLRNLRKRYGHHKAKIRACVSRQLKALDTLEDAYVNKKALEACPLCASVSSTFGLSKCMMCIWYMSKEYYHGCYCLDWSEYVSFGEIELDQFRMDLSYRPYNFKRKRLRLIDKQRNTLKRLKELI